ncbi:General substrate transporter [Niveomyces insectorum RCEF 264]|uniref:General substrate transporter n=1 Tax=Niveomyces insectorum RCEF 264 TaxID=1081102 RepID=A0A167YM07_9HYPO|nr:General substrate transporter [Niveomyces insectorum RCEF 264]
MDVEKHIDAPAHQELVVDTQVVDQVTKNDHTVSRWQAIRQNPQAFFWCLYSIWAILLVSYDNQASGIILGIPQFRRDFGYYYQGQYVLYADWQSAFTGAPLASNLVSSLVAGQVADKIGRRFTIMIALVISFAAVTLEMVATTNAMFFGGKFLNGFATGTLASVCVTYIGEISPLALRGLLTAMSALSYTVGPLIVALIINTTGTWTNRWAYRSVFCSQYGFSAVGAALVWFMPESPWWLAATGRHDEALRSLRRLGYRKRDRDGHGDGHGDCDSGSDSDVQRLAQINLTLQKIREETEQQTYWECFRYTNLRRTVISVAPLSIQSLCGVVFVASYTIYYIQVAGFSDAMSFKLQIAQQCCSTAGNIMSWFVIDRVGRRNLTLYGTAGLMVILLVCGGCASVGSVGSTTAAVALLLSYCWLYNMTIGATAFTVLCEVSTSRLRAKTIAMGISLQNVLNLVVSFVMPYLFNPDKANLGAKVTFIFGGLSVLCVTYLWFYQPETTNRSYEELDEMFVKKVPARKFKTFKTDVEQRTERAEEKSSL